jgi:hypothetical protein
MDKTVEVSQAARDAIPLVPEQIDREAAAELLGYRDWDDATDYRLTGEQDRQVARTVQAFARHRLATRATQPEAALREALELARPIVEADLASAADYSDADWIGMSQTALDAIDAALKDHRHG